MMDELDELVDELDELVDELDELVRGEVGNVSPRVNYILVRSGRSTPMTFP